MIVHSKNYQIRAGKIENCFAYTAVFTIRRINRPLLKLIPTQIHVNTVSFISILLQKRWAVWETRLQPVAWFIVSTTIFQSPQPSTLRTTPRLGKVEPQNSVHQSVWLQLHGGLQPQRKSALCLGRQESGHLSHHLELKLGSLCDKQVMSFKMLIIRLLYMPYKIDDDKLSHDSSLQQANFIPLSSQNTKLLGLQYPQKGHQCLTQHGDSSFTMILKHNLTNPTVTTTNDSPCC